MDGAGMAGESVVARPCRWRWSWDSFMARGSGGGNWVGNICLWIGRGKSWTPTGFRRTGANKIDVSSRSARLDSYIRTGIILEIQIGDAIGLEASEGCKSKAES